MPDQYFNNVNNLMKPETVKLEKLKRNGNTLCLDVGLKDSVNTKSNIAEFFKGRSVFITGSTGFMGKVLVEKLLRSCADINKIYLLLRPKNGSKLEDRLHEFKKNAVFNRLHDEGRTDVLEKLTPIYGDVGKPGLDLSMKDMKTLQDNVNVVFHCAASVRFDEKAHRTFLINTQGTHEITLIALQMRALEAFVLVSTAFSNSNRSVIDEVIYPAPGDYNYVFECMENLSDKEFEEVTTRMLHGLPNTYVLSKSLAERVVFDQRGKLPAAIFRPSLVCPAYNEPMPGWVDSKNGPMGLLIGASSGLLRSMKGDGDKKTDIIPVDFAINAMIAVAWHTATSKNQDIPVYNCTASNDLDLTWNKFLEIGLEKYHESPSMQALWYPGGSIHKNVIVHNFCFLILQLIPAIFLDAFLILSQRKPWFVKLQKKIYNTLNAVEYFICNDWTFKNSNLQMLLNHMTPNDRRDFNFDSTKLNCEDYIKRWIMGTRRFFVKLDDSTIPEAQAKLRRLYWLHQLLLVTFYGFVLWISSPAFVFFS